MRISVDFSRGLPTPLFALEAIQLARWVPASTVLATQCADHPARPRITSVTATHPLMDIKRPDGAPQR